jgi:hypothetical protein
VDDVVKVRTLMALACAGTIVSACTGLQGTRTGTAVPVQQPTKADAWKRIASADDQNRLANVNGAWEAGLGAARRNFATALREEGVLLRQDAALARPAPTPGSYECRMVSLGATARGKPAFERFKPFFCYVQVEGDLLTIVKQTGSKRPAGRLWDDDNPNRLVFLGSLALGNEDEVLGYGDDRRRDMAGVFERIAPFKWRLVIPWPQDGAKLQVFELTPVADQPE